MVKKNTCVFISGNGTNLKNLIKSSRDYNFPIKIDLIVANKLNAPGIVYAKKNSIPFFFVNTKSRLFEQELINQLKRYKISLICLAGYMKIISKRFLSIFNKPVLNIHPSLLPKFKGLDTYKKILKEREKITGCTVHFVNEKLDSGNIICKKSFFIENNDDEISLKKKTQKLEYLAYSEAIRKIYRMV